MNELRFIDTNILLYSITRRHSLCPAFRTGRVQPCPIYPSEHGDL